MREQVKNRIDDVVGMIYADGIVTSFPTSSMLLLPYMTNCRYKTYRDMAERHGVSVQDIARYLESRDGCTIYQESRDRYLIAVNADQLFARLRWTAAHEFGHILAGHFLDLGVSKLPKTQVLEEEADYFAASFLAPLAMIRELRVSNPRELQERFGLSRTAAVWRWEEYQRSWFYSKPSVRTASTVRAPDIWPDEDERCAL